MNKLILVGRLCKDPEIRYTNTTTIARFNFAVARRYKKENEADTDFFECTAFGKLAQTIEKCSIHKGTKLLLDAEVRNNNYTNKDGQKIYGMQVIVNSFEFCESLNAASQQTYHNNTNDGFVEIPQELSEELPFS